MCLCPCPPLTQYTVSPRVFSQAELSWILGAAALVPLSASAWGFGIVQGDVVSQADVGAEGFPEPLAEERRLPCGRCFREQEGAVQVGKEPGQRASSSLHPAHGSPFFMSLVLENSWLLVSCRIKPQLDFSTQDWGCLFCPTLPDLPSMLAAVVSTQAPCPWLLSSLPAPLHTC